MKYFSLLLTFCAFTIVTKAQSPEDSVKEAINQLFTAMKNADASLIKASFTDSAILQTVRTNAEGKIIIETDGVNQFAEVISKLEKNAADERIIFDVVRIDGPLAIAWTPYTFYFKGKFSHCGVDSYQLVRINGAWKIQYLIDTRRKQGCD
ncbi:MAG: nuclear transport factor 2 family protein [Bacteroidetes bacterium]|nr:nuclear transport factor 2 family protein [Bacteroidota bacterium]